MTYFNATKTWNGNEANYLNENKIRKYCVTIEITVTWIMYVMFKFPSIDEKINILPRINKAWSIKTTSYISVYYTSMDWFDLQYSCHKRWDMFESARLSRILCVRARFCRHFPVSSVVETRKDQRLERGYQIVEITCRKKGMMGYYAGSWIVPLLGWGKIHFAAGENADEISEDVD